VKKKERNMRLRKGGNVKNRTFSTGTKEKMHPMDLSHRVDGSNKKEKRSLEKEAPPPRAGKGQTDDLKKRRELCQALELKTIGGARRLEMMTRMIRAECSDGTIWPKKKPVKEKKKGAGKGIHKIKNIRKEVKESGSCWARSQEWPKAGGR